MYMYFTDSLFHFLVFTVFRQIEELRAKGATPGAPPATAGANTYVLLLFLFSLGRNGFAVERSEELGESLVVLTVRLVAHSPSRPLDRLYSEPRPALHVGLN